MEMVFDRDKKVFVFSVVFVAILTAFLVSLPYNIKENIISAHKEQLQIYISGSAQKADVLLESEVEKHKILSNLTVLRRPLENQTDKIAIQAAKREMDKMKDIVPGISLLNNNGLVVVADIDLPGTDYSKDPYFLNKEKDIIFEPYFDTVRKRYYYVVAGPVKADGSSEIVGAMGFDLDFGKINDVLLDSWSGKKMNYYLVNENGVLLSSSDSADATESGVFSKQLTSDGIDICIKDLRKYLKEAETEVEEHEEEVLRYISHTGKEVFGAHAYIPALKGCLVAEIETDLVTKLTAIDIIQGLVKK